MNQHDHTGVSPNYEIPTHNITKPATLQDLATLSMPVDTKTLLVSIDEVLADAMQTINHSLQLSSNSIEEARKRLLQDHPTLTQAYQPEPYQEPALNEPAEQYRDDFTKDQLDYQQSVLAQQQVIQDQVSSAQAQISQSVDGMQEKLIAQQKSYENKVLVENANTVKQAEQTELNADASAQAIMKNDVQQADQLILHPGLGANQMKDTGAN